MSFVVVITCHAVNGEDGEYIFVIFDTPEEAQQWVILCITLPSK